MSSWNHEVALSHSPQSRWRDDGGLTLNGKALSKRGTDRMVSCTISLRRDTAPSSCRRSMHWKRSTIWYGDTLQSQGQRLAMQRHADMSNHAMMLRQYGTPSLALELLPRRATPFSEAGQHPVLYNATASTRQPGHAAPKRTCLSEMPRNSIVTDSKW